MQIDSLWQCISKSILASALIDSTAFSASASERFSSPLMPFTFAAERGFRLEVFLSSINREIVWGNGTCVASGRGGLSRLITFAIAYPCLVLVVEDTGVSGFCISPTMFCGVPALEPAFTFGLLAQTISLTLATR